MKKKALTYKELLKKITELSSVTQETSSKNIKKLDPTNS